MVRIAALLAVMAVPALAEASAPEARSVTYKSPDGVQIVADYYAPKETGQGRAPIVIMLHQYPSTRSSWRPLAALFHDAGFAVLAPDLRGHGESIQPESMNLAQGKESRSPKHYGAAYQDVLGAYEWLRRRKDVDLSRFAIVGASIGSSVAVDYAARDKSVDVVVCLSPGVDYFGVDSRRHIAEYGDRPILLISPANERSSSETLGKAAKNATVKIIEDSKLHGTFMFGKVPGIEQTVLEFVEKHVGRPSDSPVLASMKSKKYHTPTCSYVQPGKGRYSVKPANLRLFSSAAEARSRGYTPCKTCGK